MALWIDPPRWDAHGRSWSHLVSDTSYDELHAFARSIGLPERLHEGDHYDIPRERHASVVAAGARPVEGREIVRILHASGLRMQKRKGDRGVTRVEAVSFREGQRADVDLILGSEPVHPDRVLGAQALVRDEQGHVALHFSRRRREWGLPGGWREPGESVAAAAAREVHEELGLVVAPADLEPVGYHRFRFHEGSPGWSVPGDLLQVHAVTLGDVRPALTGEDPGTDGQQWVGVDEFVRLCAERYWWPLIARLL